MSLNRRLMMAQREGTIAADSDPIAEQAAEWIVLLTAGNQVERARNQEAFEAWKRADRRHAEAAASMEHLLAGVQSLRLKTSGHTDVARRALDASLSRVSMRRRTRNLVMSMALVLALAFPAWHVLQTYPPGVLLADLRTATGETQDRVLGDGTRVALQNASAVNFHYDERHRRVELLQGEIFVDVAKDPSRPFEVETEHAVIRALGTRFVVRKDADSTLLTMLESKVAVKPVDASENAEKAIIVAGQRIRIDAAGLGEPKQIDAESAEAVWKYRRLVVMERPLPEVLDELGHYRSGVLRYDRASIADIRVSAVLPLDDTNEALRLLHGSFPQLRIRTLTPYLVMVDVAKPAEQ
jgi:transmembrane sensor